MLEMQYQLFCKAKRLEKVRSSLTSVRKIRVNHENEILSNVPVMSLRNSAYGKGTYGWDQKSLRSRSIYLLLSARRGLVCLLPALYTVFNLYSIC
jgi:hypothetical protein